MHSTTKYVGFILIFINLIIKESFTLCPEGCVCKSVSENIATLRVKCVGNASTINWKTLKFGEDASNIASLDFSKNGISDLDTEYFKNFTELRRLDLSSNMFRELNKDTFGLYLKYVERLKLSNNSISHVYQGTFENLSNLKYLDLSGNPLVCDCDLMWLVSWTNQHLVKLQPVPKCDSPPDFKGTLLKKLVVGSHLHCESPMQPLLRLSPNTNQIVFEGDELVLKCEAPRVALGVPRESEDMPLTPHWGFYWGWADTIRHENSTEDIIFRDPTKEFVDVFCEAKHTIADLGILYSILRISSVSKHHRGTWDCTLRSQQANLSKSIAIHVISKSTEYCKATKIRTNKGVYYWPQTIRGETVIQNCYDDVSSSSEGKATYECGNDGTWKNLNTEDCAFVSEISRILEQFAKVNFSLTNPTNSLEIAWRLHNFTASHITKFRDPIDLEFVARSLVKFHEFVNFHNEISFLEVDIVSKLLQVPFPMWYKAQEKYETGIKLLHAIEFASRKFHYSDVNDAPTLNPKNIFIEYFPIQVDSFAGISCLLFRELDDSALARRQFDCSTSNESFPVFEKYVDGAVQIPIHLLFSDMKGEKTIRLMISAFRNSNLLPNLNINDTINSGKILSSPIIGTKVLTTDDEAENITKYNDIKEKITVILRMYPYHNEKSEPIPAWWDANEKIWNTKVCEKLYLHKNLLMFSCNKIGYYGLLQNALYLNDFPNEDAGCRFRFLPIGIYIGCGILFICSWINIVSYIVFGNSIRMNRQQRHTLINTWLALSLLCLSFSLGIYQTEHKEICRVFGLLMHYLSLCVLLWVCVILSTMYKRLSKNHRILIDSEFPKEETTKKPIMGIYLVGWGISMIICGISSAVNINEYASYHFCFLHKSSALNAILVPAVILMVFIGIMILCIYYHLNKDGLNMLSINQFSDNTQTTENIDLDLINPVSQQNAVGRRTNTKSSCLEQYSTLSQPLSSIVDDYERSNVAHLRAQIVFLLLYVTSWLSAAFFILESVDSFSNNIIYTVVFVLSTIFLGLFLLLFYTLSRNDTWNSWNKTKSQFRLNKGMVQVSSYKPSSIADNAVVAYKVTTNYDTVNSGSRSNSQCSKQRNGSIKSMKSNSQNNDRRNHSPNQQNISMNGITPLSSLINNHTTNSTKAFNSNLHHDIPAPEIFYNPNQINVARKFFKKQKRLAKRNNFELQRQIERNDHADTMSDASSSVYSRRYNATTLLAGGSKINNTNIHYKNQINSYESKEAASSNYNQFLEPRHNEYLKKPMVYKPNRKVANIYTNIPETMTPKHEVYKVRSSSRNSKPLHLETPLSEHDELEQDDSTHDEENIPLYANTSDPRGLYCSKHNESSALLESKQELTCSTPKSNYRNIENIFQPSTIFLNHNEVNAMNSLGLPEQEEENQLQQNFQDDLHESNEQLPKDAIYVSNSLQITNKVSVDDNFSPVFMRVHQLQSKSLSNLHDFIKSTKHGSTIDCQMDYKEVKTSSCSVLAKKPSTQSLSELANIRNSRNEEDELNIVCNSYKLPNMDTCSTSPTNESDLNYQNSEISIRSHGLYAPQVDNDLNLTITDDYPYQSSNTSDIDDANNEFDEDFACFGGSSNAELPDAEGNLNIIDTSIDELYEAIKKRSPIDSICPSNSCPTNLIKTMHFIGEKKTELNKMPSLESAMLSPLNFAMNSQSENLNETIDDDSSQSSVISYIDPKRNQIKPHQNHLC